MVISFMKLLLVITSVDNSKILNLFGTPTMDFMCHDVLSFSFIVRFVKIT